MNEILFRSANDAAASLTRGEISARELTGRTLARIELVNPLLGAVVELRRDEALREATAADEQLAAGTRRPLLGVPVTVKEAFNVVGMRTTWGNPAFAGYRAERDATVVRRLKQAGAIIVGKTNVPFMLADFAQTYNDLYGSARNPWDTTRTPGGSSGGSCAALAGGLTFLEYGSDLVGSIRIPASFCGVYGLRPSVGIVPPSGFQPPGPAASPSETAYMSALGPLGRTAADLRTALMVTAGPEAPAANAYSWALAPPRGDRLADYRVGVVLDHPRAAVSSDLAGALSDAVDAIACSGARVREGWPDGVDPVQGYETFSFHVRLFLALQQADAQFALGAELIDQERRRIAARAAWGRYFKDVDVFICPTNFTPAFPEDRRPFDQRTVASPEGERPYRDQPFWTSHAALSGLPALAAPIGKTPGGLPAGAQLIGPLHEDDTALTFAELLAEVCGGYKAPPLG